MLDLESNSREKVSQSKRTGTLKEDSACNNESSAIDLRDSVAEDVGITAGKNLSQAIIPANEETIVPELKAQKGFKDNSDVLCPGTHLHSNAS